MQDNSWYKPLLEYLSTKENTKISYLTNPQPLEKGVETIIYKIQLKNAPAHISQPLVLRIYKKHASKHSALLEGITQNYLYENKYPNPKVHCICTDTTILGAQFIIMDYVEGETLSQYNKNVPQTLADLTIKLHKINPEPLGKRFLSSGIKEEHFTGLWTYEKFLSINKVEWLNSSLEWVKENKPTLDYAVIHDDLHALNVMMSDGAVSGVLDWAGLIDDRLRDVGSTLVLYNVMAPCVWPNRRSEFRGWTKLFLDLYSSMFTVDPWKLEYYEAVRCFRVMVDYEIGFELVLSTGMHVGACERFKEITGIQNLNEPW